MRKPQVRHVTITHVVASCNALRMFPVPECVVDALHLWEKERHRLVFTPCSLFRFAASHRSGLRCVTAAIYSHEAQEGF